MDVSIVVTAYNYARFLDECLDSCLGQKCTDLEYEVIVVDDGSTDETPSLLAQRSDPSLRVLRIENSGIEIASNQGFAVARGRYIVRVDADDALEPDYLARMAPLLENDFSFGYGDYTIIDSDSREQEVVSLPDFKASEVLTRGDFLATGTLYSAVLLQTYGGYNTRVRNSGLENYELIIKLIAAGAKGIHVPAPLFRYRRHSTNMSAERIDSIIAYGHALFKFNGLGPFRTNKNHPYKLILPRPLA